MNLKQIESEALHLSEDDRATLAQTLLLSLNDFSDTAMKQEWAAEVLSRAKDIDEGLVSPISSEEVMAKARNLLR